MYGTVFGVSLSTETPDEREHTLNMIADWIVMGHEYLHLYTYEARCVSGVYGTRLVLCVRVLVAVGACRCKVLSTHSQYDTCS